MTNNLFPIFLKLENLRLLIVGGGYVAMEKLQAVMRNSPATKITLVATQISEEIRVLAQAHPTINLVQKPYAISDIAEQDIVIVAINNNAVSKQIVADTKGKNILVNVADKPDLCNFYLSSVVQKGNLKIAISTNGKSPTMAKRVKEILDQSLPEEINDLLLNMQQIRNSINGDFAKKVKELNELTRHLVEKNNTI